MSFKNKSHFKNNIIFKNSYNITRINNNFNINHKIEPIENSKTNNYRVTNNINDKINLIREMINKPFIKLPYDGFAIQCNRFTVEALIQKTYEKERISLFEQNKLCKNNYPLIKFLSNRKNKNNSKTLLIEMISTKYLELSKVLENIIKYKRYKQKSLEIKNYNNKNLKNIPKLIKIKDNKFLRKNKSKDKAYLTQRIKSYNKNKTVSKFALDLKNTFNYNNIPETERVYSCLGFGETVTLYNHRTSVKNNNILLNRFIRKNYLVSKKGKSDFLQNYIINDISKLKRHKKIMPLNTELLTL